MYGLQITALLKHITNKTKDICILCEKISFTAPIFHPIPVSLGYVRDVTHRPNLFVIHQHELNVLLK